MMKKVFTLLFIIVLGFRLSAQIPAGYYNSAAGLYGLPLKTALYNIIKGHTAVTYSPGVWNAYATTDVRTGNSIWDMYSDIPGSTPPYTYTYATNQCGTYTSEGDCYNREHSIPSSWFVDADPMYTDLFHIYPTDGWVNNKRSNFPFADVGSATWTSLNGSKLGSCSDAGYTGTVFEPIDEYKGDFARSYFYMATRYENVISTWYANATEANAVLSTNSGTVFETWYIDVLLAWSNNDPVSQKEIDRNNAVYLIQHNRNPYIDHPEWILSIWGPTAGIKTVEKTVTFNLYPVPASDFVFINSTKASIDKVEVYTTTSTLIHTYLNVGKSLTIDLSDYASGVYYTKIVSGNEVVQKKFIVVK
ncbi:MAG: endonuclease [Bacteroidota bacterium]